MAADRTAISRMGGYSRWAKEDPRPALAHVRKGFKAKFVREVREAAEASGELLTEAEVARRAEAAKNVHMIRMSLESAKKRRKRATS